MNMVAGILIALCLLWLIIAHSMCIAPSDKDLWDMNLSNVI